MRKVSLLIIFLFLLQPAGAGCRVLQDAAGRRVQVPPDPQRVVALAPNIVELVYALGEGAKLKGATRFSNHPAAARKLPRVGSYTHLDLERIVALRPDLCLASQDGNPRQVVERLQTLGIPVFVINPQSLPEMMATIRQLGVLLDARAKADAMVADMARRIRAVRKRVGRDPHRPTVFFEVDEDPMVSVGSATFINELITLAGGRNLAAGPVPYPRYDWEKVLRLQPEVVIISSMAGGQTRAQLLHAWRQWPQLKAVRNHRVYVVKADLFDRPTQRLVDGLEVLARIIHPPGEGSSHAH